MRTKVLIVICLVISSVLMIVLFPEALFWSGPQNRAMNQARVEGHYLSLVWFWSLIALPLFMALSLFRKVFVILAMAIVLYTPLYLLWASFVYPYYGLDPEALVWLIVIPCVLFFEYVLVSRYIQMRGASA